jgi:hypothetical protein
LSSEDLSRETRIIDPLADSAWADLVARHPRASVFHTPGWLDALRRTYGFDPFVLTTSTGGSLDSGLVVCRVRGWRGPRLVSLPFSDHCDPLVDDPADLAAMLSYLSGEVEQGRARSVELRARSWPGPVDAGPFPMEARPFRPGASYLLHTIDLRPDLPAIFKRFHPSCVQRAVRRAEREGVTYESGTSEYLLGAFYGLLRQARRRHGLPPQPIAWFRMLASRLGDRLAIHLARLGERPVASLLTLSFGRTLVYKYGGSDAAQHRLGAMPFLFWRAIERAKAGDVEEFDLGRSDLDQPGLIAFKEHLGGVPAPLTYQVHPARLSSQAQPGLASRVARRVVASLPDPALDLAGRLVYRHLA